MTIAKFHRLAGRFLLVLFCTGMLLSLWCPAAFAHGGHEQLDVGISSNVIGSIYFVIALMTVVVAGRRMSSTAPIPSAERLAATEQVVGEVSGEDRRLAATALTVRAGRAVATIEGRRSAIWLSSIGTGLVVFLLIVVASVNDPFGSITRALLIAVFATLAVPQLGLALWRSMGPAVLMRTCAKTLLRKAEESAGSYAWTSGPLLMIGPWFFLVYPRPNERTAIFLFVFVCIGLSAVVAARGFDDPFVRAYRQLSRVEDGTRWAIAVVLGSVGFAILQQQSWWGDRLGPAGASMTSVRWTIALLGCVVAVWVAIEIVVRVLSAFGHAGRPVLFRGVLTGLLPLGSGLVVAVFLPTIVAAIQDQLYVIWDPLGRGWRPFGEHQGIDVQLVGSWIDKARVAALVLTPAGGAITGARALHLAGDRRDAVPLAVAVLAAGWVPLYVIVL